MIRDVVIAYWPFWVFGLCVALLVLESLCLARMSAIADADALRALDEREAQRAVRPSPAPIDVEPMR